MIASPRRTVNCRSLLVERRFLDSHVKSRCEHFHHFESRDGRDVVQLLTFNFQASRAIFLDPRSILETTFFRTFPREMKIQRSPTKLALSGDRRAWNDEFHGAKGTSRKTKIGRRACRGKEENEKNSGGVPGSSFRGVRIEC